MLIIMKPFIEFTTAESGETLIVNIEDIKQAYWEDTYCRVFTSINPDGLKIKYPNYETIKRCLLEYQSPNQQ